MYRIYYSIFALLALYTVVVAVDTSSFEMLVGTFISLVNMKLVKVWERYDKRM